MKTRSKRTVADYLRVSEAWICLAVAVVVLRILPFRVIMAGFDGARTPVVEANIVKPGDVPSETLTAVVIAVERAARRLPGSPSCLCRAIAGSWMLRRRAIAVTVCFGVARLPDLRAHAWLESGGRVVLGAAGAEDYTPIASFSTQSARAV